MPTIVAKKLDRRLIERVRHGIATSEDLKSLGAENVVSIKTDPSISQRRAYVPRKPPSANLDERTVEHIASTSERDRMGDSIEPKGWVLDDFKNNAQLFWMHRDWELPLGWVPRARKGTEDGLRGLFTTSRFHEQDLNPFAETIWRYVSTGVLPACSVGFRGLDMQRPESPEQAEAWGVGWPWGIKFLGQELLELSIVTIPAHAGALARQIDQDAQDGRCSWVVANELQRTLRRLSGEERPVAVAVGGLEELDELPEAPSLPATQTGTTRAAAPVRASPGAQESASLLEQVRQVVREEMRSALATRPGQRGAEPESEPIAGERDPPKGATLEARERASGPSRSTDPQSLFALVLSGTIAELKP